MAISREVIRQCIADKRHEIEHASVLERHFEFEESGNYVFVGVRHTGKSYMMYQRVRQLLRQGVGWDEILFVDFEDERLAELQTEDLNTLLEVHLELYGKRPYLFFDEIQNVPLWHKFVRRMADAKYRICVTGSNARMLSKDVATTLGGRFFIVDVYPYSFREYLQARAVTLSPTWEDDTYQRSLVRGHFNDYFYYGGLPEIGDFRAKRPALSSLYQKIYLSDICVRNGIKNERVVNILIKKLAESVKQPLSFNRMRNIIVASGAAISVPTVIDYVGHICDSWLAIPMSNDAGKLTEKEMQKKYYFIDNGLLSLFIVNPETSLLENLVAVELCRRYGRDNVFFLNTEREVDFLVPDRHLAIQVCYSLSDEETVKREVAPLVRFTQRNPDYTSLIITFDSPSPSLSLPVTSVPVWKWLLDTRWEQDDDPIV